MNNRELLDYNSQEPAAPEGTETRSTGSPPTPKKPERLIWCRICGSRSSESKRQIRELARAGLARVLVTAHKAGIEITLEQQAEVYERLLDWESGPAPDEVDLLIHEYALRAAYHLVVNESVDWQLTKVLDLERRWIYEEYVGEAWDFEAERRENERLEILLLAKHLR